MLVSVQQDRIGNLTLDAVNESTKRKIAKHLQRFTTCHMNEPLIYIQSNPEEFLETLPPSKADDVRRGWSIRIRMDAFEFLTMCGYDANTLSIN